MDCKVLMYKQLSSYGYEQSGLFEGIPYKIVGGTCKLTPTLKRKFFCILNIVQLLWLLFITLKKGDILFTMGGNLSLTGKLISIAHIKKATFVRDLCELPFGTHEETQTTKNNRHKIETVQFPRYDGVLTISDALTEYAQKYVSSSCKITKIPILVDYDKYNMNDLSEETEIPYVFHSGTLTEQKDGILGMVEAFGRALQKMRKPMRFISTGKIEGSKHEREIRDLIEKYNLQNNIVFTGYISEEELKGYLQRASLVIINKYRTQQNKYCFSTKLGEYLAAAKTVIITNVGEAMNWLKDKESAYVVEPENTEALTDAIVNVLTNLEVSRTVGQKGQEVCHNSFDYRCWSKPLVDFFIQLGKEKS